MMMPADLPEKWSLTIDWECETSRYYAEKNPGVVTRVSSGITKAFEHVEEAIIHQR